MEPRPRSWLRRGFEGVGLPTPVVGLALFALGCAVFGIQEVALQRFSAREPVPNLLTDVRIAITHIAIVAYLLSAMVYYEQVRDECASRLAGMIGEVDDGVGSARAPSDKWALLGASLAGLIAAAVISVTMSPVPTSYAPSTLNPENSWHRVLGLVLGLATGRLSALIILESGRFSDLARRVRKLDLLEPDALSPFVRLGMSGALLTIGSVAVYGLFLVDAGYLALVVSLLVFSLVIGGLALFLPLRGVRERIHAAKAEELSWCRERIRQARDALATGSSRGDLEELLAWEARITAVAEWPIDSSTLSRFALYLLIPLGSWAGGALVERLIDTLLD